MGAPWAHYFRMKIPESKFPLDPGSKLRHTKNVCKIFLLSRFKKENEKKNRSLKKKHGRPMGSAPMKKKKKNMGVQKKKKLGKSPFFFTSILGAHVSAFPSNHRPFFQNLMLF